MLEQARRSRTDLEQALDRVAAGTYGRCEQCNGEIPAERLAARPSARSCMNCT